MVPGAGRDVDDARHGNRLGLISPAAAGLAFYAGVLHNRWLFLAVPPLFVMRIAANVLDGVLARETGQAGPRGEVLNELSDAVGDCLIFLIFIFVPVALAMSDAVSQALVFSILVTALLGELTVAWLDAASRPSGGSKAGRRGWSRQSPP